MKWILALATAQLCALALVATVVPGCGPPSEPDSPDVAGSWTGTAADASGTRNLGGTLSQSGTMMNGTFTVTGPGDSPPASGRLSGTLSGDTLTYTLVVDPPPCAINVTGTATVSATRISGRYDGTNSCTEVRITNGSLDLTRR